MSTATKIMLLITVGYLVVGCSVNILNFAPIDEAEKDYSIGYKGDDNGDK